MPTLSRDNIPIDPLIYRDGRVDGLSLLLQIIPYGNEQSLLVSRDISQIERMETMRRDFIANVSHELKTPLTVVVGFSEMLSENQEIKGNGLIKHYLSLICEQTARMQRLIEPVNFVPHWNPRLWHQTMGASKSSRC